MSNTEVDPWFSFSLFVRNFQDKAVCDDTPSAPRYINFFKPFHFLAGDHLVVPIGASHISLRHRNTIKGMGEKEQTNNMLGLTQVQEEELCNASVYF